MRYTAKVCNLKVLTFSINILVQCEYFDCWYQRRDFPYLEPTIKSLPWGPSCSFCRHCNNPFFSHGWCRCPNWTSRRPWASTPTKPRDSRSTNQCQRQTVSHALFQDLIGIRSRLSEARSKSHRNDDFAQSNHMFLKPRVHSRSLREESRSVLRRYQRKLASWRHPQGRNHEEPPGVLHGWAVVRKGEKSAEFAEAKRGNLLRHVQRFFCGWVGRHDNDHVKVLLSTNENFLGTSIHITVTQRQSRTQNNTALWLVMKAKILKWYRLILILAALDWKNTQ